MLIIYHFLQFIHRFVVVFSSLLFFLFVFEQPQTRKESDSYKFKWNTVEQNTILGSFYLGYVLTELPGGRLAEMIGGYRVFGHSMLWASILTLITPFAAFIDYKALVFVRALLGFMLGKILPFYAFIELIEVLLLIQLSFVCLLILMTLFQFIRSNSN